MTLGFKSVEQKIVNEIAATLDNIAVEEVEELLRKLKRPNGYFRWCRSCIAIVRRHCEAFGAFRVQTVVVGQITEPAITEKIC